MGEVNTRWFLQACSARLPSLKGVIGKPEPTPKRKHRDTKPKRRKRKKSSR